MAENDAGRVFYLIIKELTEVLHIHLALCRVDYDSRSIKNGVFSFNTLNSRDNVAELTDTRGLDKNSVGLVLVKHLDKCLAEISDKTATNASRIHFGNLNAGVLEKAAVNADFTEFVFDKNDLLAAERFGKQLFN